MDDSSTVGQSTCTVARQTIFCRCLQHVQHSAQAAAVEARPRQRNQLIVASQDEHEIIADRRASLARSRWMTWSCRRCHQWIGLAAARRLRQRRPVSLSLSTPPFIVVYRRRRPRNRFHHLLQPMLLLPPPQHSLAYSYPSAVASCVAAASPVCCSALP